MAQQLACQDGEPDSIWLIHDACFRVKWKTMRWLASRRNASRLAIEASTPDLPVSPRNRGKIGLIGDRGCVGRASVFE